MLDRTYIDSGAVDTGYRRLPPPPPPSVFITDATNIPSGGEATTLAGTGSGFSPPTGKTTSDWANGRRRDDANSDSVTLNNQYTVVTFCVNLDPAQFVAGDYVEFRLFNSDGTPLDGYTQTPRWTIGTPPAPPPPEGWRSQPPFIDADLAFFVRDVVQFAVPYPRPPAGGFGATVDGQLLSVATALIAGQISSGSSVTGQTLQAVASLIAGSVSAGSAVSGQVMQALASILAGSVSSGSSVAGQQLEAVVSLLAGSVTAGSSVAGQTVTSSVVLVPGSAFSGVVVDGQTLVSLAQLVGGTASAGATVAGQSLQAVGSLLAGTVTAGSAIDGATLIAVASLIAGSASGSGSATVSGQTLQTLISLLAGQAQASATVDGRVVSALASVIAGSAQSSGTVQGSLLVVPASLVLPPNIIGGFVNTSGVRTLYVDEQVRILLVPIENRAYIVPGSNGAAGV